MTVAVYLDIIVRPYSLCQSVVKCSVHHDISFVYGIVINSTERLIDNLVGGVLPEIDARPLRDMIRLLRIPYYRTAQFFVSVASCPFGNWFSDKGG